MIPFRPDRRRFLRRTLPAPLALAGWGHSGCGEGDGGGAASVTVGAKDYPEQLILGEVQAQLLEGAGLPVSRRFLIPTFLLHQAIAGGEISCFVEYTGTAYTAVMQESFTPGQTPEQIYGRVRALFEERYDLRLGPPLGFANTYTIALPAARAGELGLWRMSDLADHPGLVLAAGHEFLEREDGWPGLVEHYGFETPPEVLTVDLNLVWQAVASGDADLLVGNSTDGRIPARGMVLLEDDRHYFPPYDAALVYRPDAPPEVARLAEVLGGAIDDREIRVLNRRVDVDGAEPAEVAADFLRNSGLSL